MDFEDRLVKECIYQCNVQIYICSCILSGKTFPSDVGIGKYNYPVEYFRYYKQGLEAAIDDLNNYEKGRLLSFGAKTSICCLDLWEKVGFEDGYNYALILYNKNKVYKEEFDV